MCSALGPYACSLLASGVLRVVSTGLYEQARLPKGWEEGDILVWPCQSLLALIEHEHQNLLE